MNVLLAVVVGFLAGRMLWLALRRAWTKPELLRTNYHGMTLPTAAGVVLVFALLLVEAGRSVAGEFGIGDETVSPERLATLIVVSGFALLGFIDDLVGSSKIRGLAGHLRALVRGELTTGGLKVVGGILTALVAAALVSDGPGELVVAAGVIALAANLANLLDLRPGRTIKVGLIGLAVLAPFAASGMSLVPVAVVFGAAAALLLDDLRERLMLGDTGANALGAALGLGLVMVTGTRGQMIALGVLLALNLLSEFVSFTKIFEKVPPLRAFDNLGRRSSTVDLREPGDSSDPFDAGGMPASPATESSSDRTIGNTADSLRATVGAVHGGTPAGSPSTGERRPYASESPEPEPSDPYGGMQGDNEDDLPQRPST